MTTQPLSALTMLLSRHTRRAHGCTTWATPGHLRRIDHARDASALPPDAGACRALQQVMLRRTATLYCASCDRSVAAVDGSLAIRHVPSRWRGGGTKSRGR